MYARGIEVARAQLGAEAFDQAWGAGYDQGLDAAITVAMAVVEGVDEPALAER